MFDLKFKLLHPKSLNSDLWSVRIWNLMPCKYSMNLYIPYYCKCLFVSCSMTFFGLKWAFWKRNGMVWKPFCISAIGVLLLASVSKAFSRFGSNNFNISLPLNTFSIVSCLVIFNIDKFYVFLVRRTMAEMHYWTMVWIFYIIDTFLQNAELFILKWHGASLMARTFSWFGFARHWKTRASNILHCSWNIVI